MCLKRSSLFKSLSSFFLYKQIMILDRLNKASTNRQILYELQSDQWFQSYHQTYREKLKLNFIKNSFEEMMGELLNHVKKLTLGEMDEVFDETLTRKKKIWNYSQFKLFAWISVWIIVRKQRSSLTQDCAQCERDDQFLCWLFANKPREVIAYEFAILQLKLTHQRTPWKEQEIQELSKQVELSRIGKNTSSINWKLVSYRIYTQSGFVRSTQECRERWCNHLSPSLKKNKWSIEQDIRLLQLVELNGTRWAKIAKIFADRTEHMIKNRYRSLEKRMQKQEVEKNFNIKKAVSCLKRVHNLIEWNKKLLHEKRNCLQNSEQDSLYQNSNEQSIQQKLSGSSTLFKTQRSVDLDQSESGMIEAANEKLEERSQIGYMADWGRHNYDWLEEMIEQKNNCWLEQQY